LTSNLICLVYVHIKFNISLNKFSVLFHYANAEADFWFSFIECLYKSFCSLYLSKATYTQKRGRWIWILFVQCLANVGKSFARLREQMNRKCERWMEWISLKIDGIKVFLSIRLSFSLVLLFLFNYNKMERRKRIFMKLSRGDLEELASFRWKNYCLWCHFWVFRL
jgi:hypothetical protein